MIRRAKEKLVLQYNSTVIFFTDALQRMRTHEGFKRYFKNTGWLFAGRIGGMVVTFLVGAYFARYLGPAQYGLLNYAISFAGLFIFLNSFGIDAILVRNLVEFPDNRDAILGTAFSIKLFGGLITALFAISTAFLFSTDHVANLYILLISTSYIFQAFNVVDFFFQAKIFSRNTVIVQLVVSLMLAVIKLLFIYLHFSLIFFVMIYMLEAVFLAIGFIALYQRSKLSIFRWHIDRSLARAMLRDAFPLMFANIAGAIFLRIDQVMIKHFLGSESAGVYAVAARLAEIWYFIPFIIVSSLFPAIVSARNTSVNLYELRLRRLYAFMILSSSAIAVGMNFFAMFVVNGLFGVSYSAATGALRIYIWSGVAIFLWSAVGQALIVENQTKVSLLVNLFGAISNVLLNLVLIPRYGIYGAAIATLISYFIVISSVFLFKGTRRHGYLVLKSLYFR